MITNTKSNFSGGVPMKIKLLICFILFLCVSSLNCYSQNFFDNSQVLFSNDSLIVNNVNLDNVNYWGKWNLNLENINFILSDYGLGEYPEFIESNTYFDSANGEFNDNDLTVHNIKVGDKNFTVTWSFDLSNGNFNFVSYYEGTSVSGDFTLTSASFTNDGKIPVKYACISQGGQDISPQLSWSNIPENTKYFAIIMDDPDAQSVCGYTWVHWLVVNIPANVTSLNENASIEGIDGEQVKNDFGNIFYGGPCPPNGTHKYYIKIFALNSKIEGITEPLTILEFESIYKNFIIDSAEINGLYP